MTFPERFWSRHSVPPQNDENVQLDKKAITQFQTEILSWYAAHQRDLPWRRDREPYHILVSEIMLQQTQVSRVVPKYNAWLQVFPDVSSLAAAHTSDVLRLWSGLGYNRRALYLQRTAKAVEELRMKNYELGRKEYWPRTVAELKQLPGIGEYTARAIACFAFDQQIAVVDTNVRKVIVTRFTPHPDPLPKGEGGNSKFFQDRSVKLVPSPSREKERMRGISDRELQEIADQLLPTGRAYEWNQALMDYAAARLKQEKIPIKKQSTFKGSNRYYRGQTVKLLLQQQYKGASIKYLGELLGKDEVFIERLVQELEKDGLVKRKKKQVHLA